MKPRYTDAFWGEHPFDGDMILIKNKNNKTKKIICTRIHLPLTYLALDTDITGLTVFCHIF